MGGQKSKFAETDWTQVDGDLNDVRPPLLEPDAYRAAKLTDDLHSGGGRLSASCQPRGLASGGDQVTTPPRERPQRPSNFC